ncbi:MAG: UTP--glucose-1-phosphate uridylyltransferase [Deltaproteobacteria bacterium]|nr:UTP--glucose-1-phosphate uridylyltransferase [Deltaproteobacteria bacterium]
MPDMLRGLELDEPTAAILRRFGFDRPTWERLRAALRAGWDESAQRVGSDVAPPPADSLVRVPTDAETRARHEKRGLEAIARGEVGAVVLAGGMATRFGGVVKAAVDALPGRTFLALKLASIEVVAKRAGGQVPVALMTSFATEDAVAELAKPHAAARTFPQFVSLRLTPSGDVFREADGSASPYAPGHGDLTFALRSRGVLGDFARAGVRVVFVSNVDNLAASLDPVLVGMHLEGGAAASVEVVDKVKGDRGGAPAVVGGVPQIVESFRFPPEFDQDRIPVFNTNTFWFDLAAIDRDFDLTWCRVEKKVESRVAIQLERLCGEVTRFLPTRFLVVARSGSDSRFLPVKDVPELEARKGEIESVMRAIGVDVG